MKMKMTGNFFLTVLMVSIAVSGAEIIYDGADRGSQWRHSRTAEQQKEFYSQNICAQQRDYFLWEFSSKEVDYNDLNLAVKIRKLPRKLSLKIKNTGEECLLSIKLVDAESVNWITKKVMLPGEMKRPGVFEFDLDQITIASWSRTKGSEIKPPFRLTLVASGILPGLKYRMEIYQTKGNN